MTLPEHLRKWAQHSKWDSHNWPDEYWQEITTQVLAWLMLVSR